ncbi:MAG: Crp/Fnr family transcriptional regulator [Magnetovibrionaceae bacterium]
MSQQKSLHWRDHFPDLAALDADCAALLDGNIQSAHLDPGTTVFRAGDPCGAFILLVEGSVRVQQITEQGREIVLYRVEPGQTCILTTACLLGDASYEAEAVVEAPTDALLLSVDVFNRLLASSDVFRRFVFTAYSKRMTQLMQLTGEVAFGRKDIRLAAKLLEQADEAGRVALTHQALAVELGTAREVVSRLLKEFERKGWLALGRGTITLTDPNGLRALAELDA